MAAQIIGTFQNDISAGARQAAGDLRGLQAAAESTTSALGALGAAGGSAIPPRAGGRAGGAAPTTGGQPRRPSAGAAAPPNASAARDQEAREPTAGSAARKAAREQEAAAKYVAGIKDRYFLAEQRRQEKEERDNARSEQRKLKELERAREKEKAAREKAKEKAAEVRDSAIEKLKTAAGVVGVAYGAKELGQLALGYRGVSRLIGITTRAQFRFRQLFVGVQPKPFLDTIEKVSFLFSKQTIAGRALAGLFERGFNGFFGAVKGAEPFILDFVKGVILGALRLENAWLRARIALFPLTSAISGLFNQVGVGAALGQVAIGLLAAKFGLAAVAALQMGAASLAAAAPYIAIAAAATLAYKAVKSLIEIQKLQKEYAAEQDKTIASESRRINLIAQAQGEARRGGLSPATRAALQKEQQELTQRQEAARGLFAGVLIPGKSAADISRENWDMTKSGAQAIKDDAAKINALLQASGESAGAAMGAGMVAGMKGAEPRVTAGGAALGAAADKGVRSPAGMDARSPARKGIRSGRDMGEGVAVGMEASEERVAKAAASSLAPDVLSAAKGRSGAMAGETAGGARVVHLHFPGYLGTPEDLIGIVRRAIADEFTLVAGAEGLDTQGAT